MALQPRNKIRYYLVYCTLKKKKTEFAIPCLSKANAEKQKSTSLPSSSKHDLQSGNDHACGNSAHKRPRAEYSAQTAAKGGEDAEVVFISDSVRLIDD